MIHRFRPARCKRILFAFICALLLSGCTLKVVTTLVADGTIAMGFVARYDLDERSALETAGVDVEGLCKEPLAGIMVEPVEEDNTIECSFFTSYASLDSLRQTYLDTGYVTVNRLELVNNVLYYDVNIDLSKGTFSGLDPNLAQIEWHLIIPESSIRENNADIADTGGLIWELEPGVLTNARAEVVMGGLGLSVINLFSTPGRLLCLGGGFLAVLMAAGLTFLLARRSKKDGL